MPEEMSYNDRLKLNARVDELNALALAEALAAFRTENEERFRVMENRLAAMEANIQNQSQVIGNTLQNVWGGGATEPDPNPEDTR